jgi:FMN phosphatase YigB (HAD superfamily)
MVGDNQEDDLDPPQAKGWKTFLVLERHTFERLHLIMDIEHKVAARNLGLLNLAGFKLFDAQELTK